MDLAEIENILADIVDQVRPYESLCPNSQISMPSTYLTPFQMSFHLREIFLNSRETHSESY